MKTKSLLLLLFIVANLTFAQQKDTITIIVMHTNDMHGYIENYPKMKPVIDSIRKENANSILVSSGDLFSGNPFVDKYKRPGYPMIDLMKKMGYKLTALGNHEFDYGQDTLKTRITEAGFPFICANIITKKSVLNGYIKPYYIIKTANVKIAFISGLKLTDKNIPESLPKNLKNLKFTDPVNTILKYNFLKDSADIVIANTHLGFHTDSILASQNTYIDVILGGHSHTEIDTPVVVNNTPICQAKSYNKFLGVLTIKLLNNKIISINDKLIPIKSRKTEDKEIAQIVKKYFNNPDFRKTISTLPKNYVGKEEIGKLMASAFAKATKADIAFMNHGGIRIDTLKKGNIRYLDIFKLDPFNNDLMIAKLTVNEIKSFLKYAYNKKHKAILTGNINIKYTEKNGKLEVSIFDNKQKEITEGEYTVVINSYMATAYDFKGKNKFKNTGVKSNDAIIEYLKNLKP